MNTTMVTGLVGLVLMGAFVGFMVWWVPAPPLIVIVVGVFVLAVIDFLQTLRSGESGA